MKIKILSKILLAFIFGMLFLATGCLSIDAGFSKYNSPADVASTQALIKSVETNYTQEGKILKITEKEGRFATQGENQIEGMEIIGSLEAGELSASADSWVSKKEGLIVASGDREAGNLEAVGDAVGEAIGAATGTGAIGDLIPEADDPE